MEPENIHIHQEQKLSSKYIFLLIIPVLIFLTVLVVAQSGFNNNVAGITTESSK